MLFITVLTKRFKENVRVFEEMISLFDAIFLEVLKRTDGKLSIWHRIACGGVVGILYWVTIFPLDGLKTRLLANPDTSIRAGEKNVCLRELIYGF